MISAAFTGLGGALYAHYQLQVSPPPQVADFTDVPRALAALTGSAR